MVLVVFDFDRTLSADEIGQWHDHSNMRYRGFGGAERLAALALLLRDLKGGGTWLGICSYNSKKVICKALTIVGLAEFFDPALIYGREIWESKGCSGRWSKADVIRAHIIATTGVPVCDVLFADDDECHCRDVATALPEARVIQVPQPLQRGRPASNLAKAGSKHAWSVGTSDMPLDYVSCWLTNVCLLGCSASGAHGRGAILGGGARRMLHRRGRSGWRCAQRSGCCHSHRRSGGGGPHSRVRPKATKRSARKQVLTLWCAHIRALTVFA